MLFKTHLMFALSLWLILNYVLEMPIWAVVFVLLGALFVDIDGRKSVVGKRIIFRPLQVIFKHRGFIHSFVACVVLSLIMALFNMWAGFGFFVGYLSHLIADMMTPNGVQFFWPLKFKIKGGIKSGGIIEQVIFVLLLLGNIFVVGKMLFNIFF